MSNADTVKEIYAAFGAGDMPTVLGHIADDCAWEQWSDNHLQRTGAEFFAERRGPDGVAGFFAAIGRWEIHDFQVLDIIGDGRQVAAEIVTEVTPEGGSRVRDEEMHLWTFDDDGKVVRLRHYVDTAKHIGAT